MTGALRKIELRNGTDYSCTDVTNFLQPLVDEFLTGCPGIPLLLRGDSGFATPNLYKQCETNGTSYVIPLKENCSLRKLAADIEGHLFDLTKNDKASYAVAYGEFMYQAQSWDYPRRVVCKVEKQAGQLVHMFTFIITNMDSSPEELIRFYCKRGTMENFIRKSKNGFDFVAVGSPSKAVDANHLQIHALAYNIFNWFKRLALSAKMRKQQIGTIRLKLLKIATKVVRSARYTIFKLYSNCSYKDEFYETLENNPESTDEAGITLDMNLDSRITHKRFHRDFIPFLRHLIRNMATEWFNHKETELFCQDSAGMNNLGLVMRG